MTRAGDYAILVVVMSDDPSLVAMDDASPRRDVAGGADDTCPPGDRVDVSVVVPCHGCHRTLGALVHGVDEALRPRQLRLEFVLVADDSPTDWEAIEALADRDRRVRGMLLSARAGQHGAIAVGLREARGDVVVVMDGDLQHRPADVPLLLDALVDGVDVVVARRTGRHEGILVRAGSALFFVILSWLLGSRVDAGLSSFSVLRRAVVDALPHERGAPRHHLLEALTQRPAARFIPVVFPARTAGQSAYALGHRVGLALDLWGVAAPRWRSAVQALGAAAGLAALACSVVVVVGGGTAWTAPWLAVAAVALLAVQYVAQAKPGASITIAKRR
jgi:dolichol-phosphate mannosyltransferase